MIKTGGYPLINREKRPTKGGAAACSGSRSRTKRRAEAGQEGAPPAAKQSHEMIGIPQSEVLRAGSRAISGVDDLEFTLNLMGQVFAALWQTNSDCDKRERDGTLAAMIDIKPRDALEGMLIGQAIASHNAAMECYRRAMINEQTFEGRRENLNQANKLSRTFAALIEALDRHRGKGQQRITVEHVNVHPGGQAIVGAVTSRRESPKSKEQTGATREITHEPSTPLRSPDPEWEVMPIASGAGKAPV